MSNKPKQFRRPARVETLTVPFDPNDAADILPAQRALQSAKDALEAVSGPGAPDVTPDARTRAETAVSEAQATYDAALEGKETVTFTFRALSGSQLQILQTDHPPTDEQVAQAKVTDPNERPDHNPATYYPALLAEACTKVEWSDGTEADKLLIAEATDFWESSSFGDQQLMMTVIGLLNQLPSRVDRLLKG